MTTVNWGFHPPQDHRANRLHDAEFHRSRDLHSPSRTLYSNGPRPVLDQLELFDSLEVTRAPAGSAGDRFRYRVRMPDGYPTGFKSTVGVLLEILTLAHVEHIDVALALDWYKQIEEGVNPNDWENTRAGQLNYISKYYGEGPERRRARAEVTDLLCEVITNHQILATCDIIMSTPGSRGDGHSHGEKLAEAVAAALGRRLVKPTSAGPRAERKSGGQLSADLEIDLVDTFYGEGVLILDDVFRTGSTLRATALAARRAGAGRVTSLVIARTLRS